MSRLVSSPSLARTLRIGGVTCAAITSIATFGGTSDWELSEQERDETPVMLTASAASWSDDFRGSGSGTGAKRLRFDGAIEVTPSATLDAPVRVKLSFVPAGAGEPIAEETVFVTGTQVFTAVHHDVPCPPDVTCVNEGTLTIDVLDAAALGSNQLAVHWVTTANLKGDGPSRPADASLTLALP